MSQQLVNIAKVNQNELRVLYDFAIRQRENILVFGPSGAGKTEMAFQSAKDFLEEEEKKGNNVRCECIYWNMSVMERPDIQGLPVVSNDKLTSSFAPQEGLPYYGLKELVTHRAINDIINNLSGDNEYESLVAFAKDVKKRYESRVAAQSFKKVQKMFSEYDEQLVVHYAKKFEEIGAFTSSDGDKNNYNILLLDEVDKTPPENLQPLLELLLYRTINGRPLDISAIFMTGNLPDEQTHSEPLSHAITNRAMVVQLEPSPSVWLDWAIKNNIHPLVVGFLSDESNCNELFNARPSNNTYCYAYTSPRAWAACSRVNYKFDENYGIKTSDNINIEKGDIKDSNTDFENERFEALDKMRKIMNSSIIGEFASNKIEIWFKYYRKYSKFVNDVFEGGNGSIEDAIRKNSINEQEADKDHIAIVIGMALVSKFHYLANNSDDIKLVNDKLTHIFKWVEKNIKQKEIENTIYRTIHNRDIFEKHEVFKNEYVISKCLKLHKEVNSISKETIDKLKNKNV